MALLESNDNLDNPLTARHLSMTLMSAPSCVFSHCCRITLLEKDVEGNIEYIGARGDRTRLGETNPYCETPTLIDRDLILYGIGVIIEYFDERFPHPPLMPVDPVNRAKIRLIISRLTRDWLQPIKNLEDRGKLRGPSKQLKLGIQDGLLAISPLFARQPFFAGDEYTLADSYFLPLLWRLPALGIALPKQAEPLARYARRMFNRAAFTGSLSPREAALR